MMDEYDIDGVFSSLPAIAHGIQDTRVQIALANQQYRDARNGTLSLATLAYYWQSMSDTDKVLLTGFSAFVIYSLTK